MKNKKLAIALTSISLVAVLAIGGTLAYFSTQTATKQNTFTMGEGVTGEIDEPSWDPEKGLDFYPGKVIAKDPLIRNLSEADTTDKNKNSVYAAATITYQVWDATAGDDGNGGWVDSTYQNLDGFINIQHYEKQMVEGVETTVLVDGFNTDATTGWTLNSTNTIAYYNAILLAQSATSPIFDAVEIDILGLTPDMVIEADAGKPGFELTNYDKTVDAQGNIRYEYAAYQMSDFQIVVQGYLVQADGFNSAQEAMLAAFPTVFGTN